MCVAPLALQSFPNDVSLNSSNTETRPTGNATSSREGGPYILSCPHCTWSTLDIGIKFEKSINTIAQLSKIQKEESEDATTRLSSQSLEHVSKMNSGATKKNQFDLLRDFYRTSLAESQSVGPLGTLSSSFGLDSPSQLSRLLSTYGVGGLKKQRQKPVPMREAEGTVDGLIPMINDEDDNVIKRMESLEWDCMATADQCNLQRSQVGPATHALDSRTHFTDQLRPAPAKLRSKRSKRCQQCRYHLVRPDDKRHSARYKLRLLALNFIPRVTTTQLHSDSIRSEGVHTGVSLQYVVTCRNPLYDPVKLKLATPNTVPGSNGTRVTILCPQFDIGASTDVWDEALDSAKASTADGVSSHRGVPEAGKVWKKGRNWTSVVLELLPGRNIGGSQFTEKHDRRELEIPILVRMEYFTDSSAGSVPNSPEGSTGYKSAKEERAAKELAFWIVLGLDPVTSSTTH